MDVIFLGTAAAEGLPAPYCSCDICKKARRNGGKDLRLRSSVLIDGIVKIDESPDTLAQAQKLGLALEGVKTLLITHTHEDHLYADDVLLFVPPFSHTYKGPLNILGPGGVAECVMRSAIHSWAEEALDIKPLLPFRTVKINGGYEVTSLLAHHVPERTCLNYVVRDPGGAALLYAGDTGFWPDETFDFLKNQGVRLDTVVMEATNGALDNDDIHLSVKGAIRMRQRLLEQGNIEADTPYYATHFCHGGNMLHADLEEAFGPHNILPAYDGLRMEVAKPEAGRKKGH